MEAIWYSAVVVMSLVFSTNCVYLGWIPKDKYQ